MDARRWCLTENGKRSVADRHARATDLRSRLLRKLSVRVAAPPTSTQPVSISPTAVETRRYSQCASVRFSLSALLPRMLALDAVPRPGNRFQPPRFNVTAAIHALSKLAPPDTFESLGKCF